MRPAVTELAAVRKFVARGALFVLNDSGGKDSQAQRIRLTQIVPRDQLLVVHATLGRFEWEGALEHAQAGAARAGVPFLVASARKTYADLVRHRHRTYPHAPAFPGGDRRQCTSDLKRDPIVREVRRYATAHGFTTIVTALGIRALESARRRKKRPLVQSNRYSTGGRAWWELLPIHHLDEHEVFSTIREAGEQPHPAYPAGNRRLSCRICYLACPGDVRNGALHSPEVFEELVGLEHETGCTMHQSRRPLEEVAGLTVAEAYAQRRHLPVIQPQPARAA